MEQEFIPLLNRLGIETDNINAIHWIGAILCIVLLFYISSFVCQRCVIPIVNAITKKTRNKWDDIIFSTKNLKHLCNLVVGILLMALLEFFVYESSQLHSVVTKICSIYLTIVFTSLCCGLFTSFYQISNQVEKTKNHTLQGVFQMLKIIVICIGTIIVASIIIDKDPTKLLAGLGASAAVLMLVFKDSIMGLVAGVQLAANDMLHPGDWITVEKYGADGTVLDVTLTTVKVENWDKTITTIPPYALVSDSFQNWRGMFNSGGRRIKRSIYIDMSSIAFCDDTLLDTLVVNGILKESDRERRTVNLTVFRQWLEEWLHNHPSVNKNMIIMVRQLQPTSQGLPLELYFFFDGTRWVDYEHLQAEIFEQVFALLPQFGLKVFQSPTGNDIKGFAAN